MDDQPISSVEWVDPSTLRANGYNPNAVAPPEMRLLRISIIENGWTQPIVAQPDGEIVDGFHRWTLGSKDKEIRAMTGGLVPVVRVKLDPADSRLATVRHNRARGSHAIVKMADIVADLIESGLPDEEIERRLGMDEEEVERLRQRGNSLTRKAGSEFNRGWVPGAT